MPPTIPPLRLFRWPGAKSHLVPALAPVLDAQLAGGGRLISLFYGTGALEQSIGSHVEQIAAEANPDLRALYRALANSAAEVDRALREFNDRIARTPDGFASVRALEAEKLDDAERGARFLWLSRFAFNGIWRVNRAGLFNVPPDAARLARSWPLPDLAQLESVGGRVRRIRFVDDWRDALSVSRPADVVVSDPPYLGGFAAYTAAGFNRADHVELADRLRTAVANGAAVIAFNSPQAAALYEPWSRVTHARRSGRISSCGARRHSVPELIAFAGLTVALEEAA